MTHIWEHPRHKFLNLLVVLGVPDFVDKMHQSAKQLHEQKKKKKPVTGRQTADDDDRQDNKGSDKVPMWVSLSELVSLSGQDTSVLWATLENPCTKEPLQLPK